MPLKSRQPVYQAARTIYQQVHEAAKSINQHCTLPLEWRNACQFTNSLISKSTSIRSRQIHKWTLNDATKITKYSLPSSTVYQMYMHLCSRHVCVCCYVANLCYRQICLTCYEAYLGSRHICKCCYVAYLRSHHICVCCYVAYLCSRHICVCCYVAYLCSRHNCVCCYVAYLCYPQIRLCCYVAYLCSRHICLGYRSRTYLSVMSV